jgi:hypothetical protein
MSNYKREVSDEGDDIIRALLGSTPLELAVENNAQKLRWEMKMKQNRMGCG